MKHHKGRIIRKVMGGGGGGGGWENTKQNSCKQAKMSGKKFLQAETEEKKYCRRNLTIKCCYER